MSGVICGASEGIVRATVIFYFFTYYVYEKNLDLYVIWDLHRCIFASHDHRFTVASCIICILYFLLINFYIDLTYLMVFSCLQRWLKQ